MLEFIIACAIGAVLWSLLKSPKQKKKSSKVNYRSKSPRSSAGQASGRSSYSHSLSYRPIKQTKSGIPIKSDSGYRGPFIPSSRKKSDFTYPENPNPQEFLVYFIASEELGALKIGVGTSGRVIQLLNSTIRTDEGFEKVGWLVLRTAAFSSGPDDFESGREAAYEAERRVLFYWRNFLRLEAKVSDREMGWAEMDYQGRRGFHSTKGFTETVDLDSVCEVSTWNLVMKSPGYLGEGSSFYPGRELRSNAFAAVNGAVAPGYDAYSESLRRRRFDEVTRPSSSALSDEPADRNAHSSIGSIPKTQSIRRYKSMPKSDGTPEGKFWARVEMTDHGCWNWVGSISTDAGYALMLWEGAPKPAHRISWQLKYGQMPKGDFLINQCGTRSCVNPDHWELKKVEERKCLTPDCEGISIKKLVDGYCARCERRRRYLYRKSRPNPYVCVNSDCTNPSATVAFASLCHSCRRKESKQL